MCTIKKKAHLGDRRLTSETVANDITTIEDWAYAHCKNLRRINIPVTVAHISPKAFEGCEALTEINIYEDNPENASNDNSHLLALAIQAWPDTTEKMIVNAYNYDSFFTTFDEHLIKYLSEPDEVGFNPFLAGGEEDYEDEANDIDYYMHAKKINKCTLIYERMLSEKLGHAIDHDIRSDYLKYIVTLKLDAAFAALIQEDTYSSGYRTLYFDTVTLANEDIQSLMDIADKDVELQSMLISHSLDTTNHNSDSFDIFSI